MRQPVIKKMAIASYSLKLGKNCNHKIQPNKNRAGFKSLLGKIAATVQCMDWLIELRKIDIAINGVIKIAIRDSCIKYVMSKYLKTPDTSRNKATAMLPNTSATFR